MTRIGRLNQKSARGARRSLFWKLFGSLDYFSEYLLRTLDYISYNLGILFEDFQYFTNAKRALVRSGILNLFVSAEQEVRRCSESTGSCHSKTWWGDGDI